MRGQLKGKRLTDEQIKGHIAELLSDRVKREFENVENLTEYATKQNDFITNYILVEIIERTNLTLQVSPEYTVEEFRYAPHKFKRCEVCGSLFYDATRNGRQAVCKTKISYKYDQQLGQFVQYTRKGRTVYECERIRENFRKSGPFKVYEGSACSYSATTRERLERELFVWTSFQGDTPEEQRRIDAMEYKAQGYGINGRRKGAVVHSKDDQKGGGISVRLAEEFPDLIEAEPKQYNLYDMSWEQVVGKGLGRLFKDEQEFNMRKVTKKQNGKAI